MNELLLRERNEMERFFKENLSNDRPLQSKIRWLLKYIGITPANKGHEYISEALFLLLNDKEYIYMITKRLYPDVAEICNTTSSRVERAIRHSIELVFGINMSEEHKKLKIFIFGVSGQKNTITNSEFLAGLMSFLLEYLEEEF